MASAPWPGSRPPWPLPRPPSARAWWSLAGLTGSAPRLASRGLAPPEGLWPGNHWLAPQGSGWDFQNKQNEPQPSPPHTPPCSSLGGELPLTSCTDTPDHLILQSRPLGKEQNGSPVDEEGCDWETPVTLGTASEPLRGGLTEPQPRVENRQIWVLAEWP